MWGFGSSSRRKCCGAESQPETKYFPTVPTCPGQIPFNAAGCTSNKGKFYDKLLSDLMLPISGQDVKAYVCEPGLWSSCQWAAICYGDNSIAVLKVIGLGSDHIKLVNACGDGGPIEDNPAPGSRLANGSVIYPVPPPWCSEQLCNKITAALENGDCACQGVLSCLQNSEEICFSALPTIEDGEELHLFGGTMITEQGNPTDNPSLWKSCLKKLGEIFTGYTGKSICFSDLPETTTSPDIVDGSPVAKRQVLLDGFNCLRKGPPVTTGSCSEDLNITKTEDQFNADADKKERTFEMIKVCRAGTERMLLPSVACMSLISRKTTDGDLYWEETPLLGRKILFDTPMVLNLGVNINLTDYDKYKKMAGDCNLYAVISMAALADGNSAANGSTSYIYNGLLVGYIGILDRSRGSTVCTDACVKLTENKITIVMSSSGVTTNYGFTARLRGYQIGG